MLWLTSVLSLGKIGKTHDLHPGRLTWNIQITHLERNMIFQTPMILFHVNLPGLYWKIMRSNTKNVHPKSLAMEPENWLNMDGFQVRNLLFTGMGWFSGSILNFSGVEYVSNLSLSCFRTLGSYTTLNLTWLPKRAVQKSKQSLSRPSWFNTIHPIFLGCVYIIFLQMSYIYICAHIYIILQWLLLNILIQNTIKKKLSPKTPTTSERSRHSALRANPVHAGPLQDVSVVWVPGCN